MRDLDKSGMKSFDALDSREKTIAIILGDRWWPQTAKQDGDKICRRFLCSVWKKRNEYLAVGGVSLRSRNGAPSRKRCVVNGQTTKARYSTSSSTHVYRNVQWHSVSQGTTSVRIVRHTNHAAQLSCHCKAYLNPTKEGCCKEDASLS